MSEKGLKSPELQGFVAKPQPVTPSSKPDAPTTHPEWGPPNSKPDALGQIASLGSMGNDDPPPPPVDPGDVYGFPPSTGPVEDIKGDSLDEKDQPPEIM